MRGRVDGGTRRRSIGLGRSSSNSGGLPEREIIVVGDDTYAALEQLGRMRAHVTAITRLRLDARLYEPAPPRQPGTTGRTRKKGERLPTLLTYHACSESTWPVALRLSSMTICLIGGKGTEKLRCHSRSMERDRKSKRLAPRIRPFRRIRQGAEVVTRRRGCERMGVAGRLVGWQWSPVVVKGSGWRSGRGRAGSPRLRRPGRPAAWRPVRVRCAVGVGEPAVVPALE
jgi:hypothetical protein